MQEFWEEIYTCVFAEDAIKSDWGLLFFCDDEDTADSWLSSHTRCQYLDIFAFSYYGCYCAGLSVAYNALQDAGESTASVEAFFSAFTSILEEQQDAWDCNVQEFECDFESGETTYTRSEYLVVFDIALDGCTGTDLNHNDVNSAIRSVLTTVSQDGMATTLYSTKISVVVTFSTEADAMTLSDEINTASTQTSLAAAIEALSGSCTATVGDSTYYNHEVDESDFSAAGITRPAIISGLLLIFAILSVL
jgi:hypothetical protein